MCGIAGFVGNGIENREHIMKAMNQQLIHRGPDAEGIWMDDKSGVTFGHRRLAIVDLSENGAQPMISSSGRFVIAYNGEIYNALELKQTMERRGHRAMYRGTSDTEVLLELIETYGLSRTLPMIKGMFAIALYDREEKTLTLIRDRVGEKPLFYGFVNGHFVFASELGAMRQFPGFSEQLDAEAIKEYIRYGYVPAPRTIYQNIHKLMPGSLLTLAEPFHKKTITTYWSMEEAAIKGEKKPFGGSFWEAAEELDRLLCEAIRGQMVSDVALGAYLSAGIDSATIVALMSKISEEKIKTFTIGFEDRAYNEAEDAKRIAKHLGTDHTQLYVSEKELKDVIPLIPEMYGEPFADSSQIPTYLVSKLAKSKVTVSLSGDAGDELFCGYSTYYKLLRVFQKSQRFPGALRHSAGKLGSRAFAGNHKIYRSGLCLLSDDILSMKEALGHTSSIMDRIAKGAVKTDGATPLQDPCEAMMLDDMLHYHPDDILVKVDRAGMAVSLENRIPMLDRDVMEFAWSLPIDFKYDGTTTKRILKEVLYQYVPKELMDRPKKGFSVPLDRWLREGDTAQWAKELMLHSKAAEDGILDKKQMQLLMKGFEKKEEPSRLVWNVLMFEQWYRARKAWTV